MKNQFYLIPMIAITTRSSIKVKFRFCPENESGTMNDEIRFMIGFLSVVSVSSIIGIKRICNLEK